ncbi:MAG: hypothetical protein K2Y21_00205 [Phycisphaerales bacterium]|nr:hypothetical protein [Phycisphaerales bacterium]
MTETLEPIHTIPLGPTLTGEVARAELQFAVENGKPVLYAAVPVWNATWGRWFMWHAPEIMVGVWLVVLIVLVWRVLHVRRTPREAGRRYCRRCNHQLTKPQLAFDERGRVQWAFAESKCPECGYRSKRVPVRGRKAWVRRLPWIVVALVPLLVLPLFVWMSLEQHQNAAFSPTPTWPMAGLERAMGSAALQRAMHPSSVETAEFWRIDLEEGRVTRRYSDAVVSQFTGHPFVAPGGRLLVASSDNLNELVVLDTATGSSRFVSHPRMPKGYPGMVRVVGFLDATRALIQRQSSGRHADTCELDILHLPDGPFETIATVDVPRRSPTDVHRFVVALRENRVVWVLESTSFSPGGPQGSQIRMPFNDGIRTLSAKAFSLDARFSTDGSAIVISDGSTGREEAFDSITGEPIAEPGKRLLARAPEHPTLRGTMFVRGLAAVTDDQRPGVRFTLPAGTPTGFPFPSIAPVGRFAVHTGDREVRSYWREILTGKPTRLEGEIRIFRIPDPPAK